MPTNAVTTHHSPLPDPRTESPRPEPLESLVWPAAADAKLEGSCEGMASLEGWSLRDSLVFCLVRFTELVFESQYR